MLRVLILGGYGTFGGRLARLLAGDERLDLVIAGRSLAAGQAFCVSLNGQASAAAFDRDGDVESQLRALVPDLVVDASGPFQLYGGDPYRVVRASLALGMSYLDLADGSDFVEGITQFDAQARARGVFVLSGVSSFPVLTAAVTRALSRDMYRVEAVVAGIAPSPHVEVGLNVIRAIASYAGKPVVGADGTMLGYGLIAARRFTIAPPGAMPLWPRRFSLVDAPDLRALPRLWPGLRTVFTGAGPVPGIMHRALSACAWLVRLRLLPSLTSFAPFIHRTRRVLTWGEHRGGMFVVVEGMGAGDRAIARSWHLIAEGDEGPFIPSMAAAAVVARCRDGDPPAPGARAAVTELELDDYAPWLEARRIVTGTRQCKPGNERASLFRRLLGEAWDRLPMSLRTMHDVTSVLTGRGQATVERGEGLLARLLAALIGFPAAGKDVAVEVEMRSANGRETWRRTFGGQSFDSVLEEGRGDALLWERFGPLAGGMALVCDGDRLRWVMRGWRLAGIALPRSLAPRIDVYETERDGRFHFHVEIGHPLVGLIVCYDGWLAPVD
jgi:Domain of unknown function (DUF4166)